MSGGRTAGHYFGGQETAKKICGWSECRISMRPPGWRLEVGSSTVGACCSHRKGFQHVCALCAMHHVMHGTQCTHNSARIGGTTCAPIHIFLWATMPRGPVWAPNPFLTTFLWLGPHHEGTAGKGYHNPDGGACHSTATILGR